GAGRREPCVTDLQQRPHDAVAVDRHGPAVAHHDRLRAIVGGESREPHQANSPFTSWWTCACGSLRSLSTAARSGVSWTANRMARSAPSTFTCSGVAQLGIPNM